MQGACPRPGPQAARRPGGDPARAPIAAGPLLDGSVALVAGAGRGVGRAVALGLAGHGAAVMVAARTVAELAGTAEAITLAGGAAAHRVMDATSRPDVEAAVEACEATFGPIDLLVSSVGVAGPFGPLGVVDAEDWWTAAGVHIRAPLLLWSAVLPRMRARGRGRIINIASLAAGRISSHLSAYGVGKAAQRTLLQHAAEEVRSSGVSVFGLEPGAIYTGLSETVLASADARRWAPALVELVSLVRDRADPALGAHLCVRQCVALAAGGYDALSGLEIGVADDLAGLLASGRNRPPRLPPCI